MAPPSQQRGSAAGSPLSLPTSGSRASPPLSHLAPSGGRSGSGTPSSCRGPGLRAAPRRSSARGWSAAGPGTGPGGPPGGPAGNPDLTPGALAEGPRPKATSLPLVNSLAARLPGGPQWECLFPQEPGPVLQEETWAPVKVPFASRGAALRPQDLPPLRRDRWTRGQAVQAAAAPPTASPDHPSCVRSQTPERLPFTGRTC